MSSLKTVKTLAIAGAMILVGIALIFNFSLLDETQTTVIAESAFKSFAKHQNLSIQDFDAMPLNQSMQDERMVVLIWKSKSKLECRIEVDVDRRYSNARPTWNCE
jgi:hypothetical protein